MSISEYIKKQRQLKTNKKEDGEIIEVDEQVLLQEMTHGIPVADSCCITDLSANFAWKRTFQNVFTGYPNDGKTYAALFLMVVKSLHSKWKWVIWSPEMKSANFIDNKVRVNYNDLINDIAWIVTGKTPYKHVADKYSSEQLTSDEMLKILPWIKEHFVFLNPKEKTPEAIYELIDNIYQEQGYDGVLIDPFKNIEQNIKVRDDIFLEQLFARFKDLAVKNNIVMNWIAHPKANVTRIQDGQLMPCDQYMLNGGAAWNNSMDGIYSIFRWNTLEDPKDTGVWFLNLKQRKQALVAERGTVKNIEFDYKTYRYLFNGKDVVGTPFN